MELYITIPLLTMLFFFCYCIIWKYFFPKRRKGRTLEWFFEKIDPVSKRLREREFVLLFSKKSTEFPHFLYNSPISSSESKTIGHRFFYTTFFNEGTSKCEGSPKLEGCVYFGSRIIGPSRINHGIDAVHGGASVAFTLEQMQVFALRSDGKYKNNNNENAFGILLEEIAIRYYNPIPIDSVQKFEIFFNDEEGVIIGRILAFEEDEKRIFVECKGVSSSSSNNNNNHIITRSEEEGYYRKHYDYFFDLDTYPPDVEKDIFEKVVSKGFEYEELFVYESDNPRKFKRRHLPRGRFMNTPDFQYIGREQDFLKNNYFFYRFYKSPSSSKTSTNERSIIYIFFGSDSCDESGFVHDGAICGVIDIITAWSCISFTPLNYSCFTKSLKIKFSDNNNNNNNERRRRIRRYQFVRMECTYIFDAELFRGGKKRRYGIVEGSISSILSDNEEEEEEEIYASVTAQFTSIEKK